MNIIKRLSAMLLCLMLVLSFTACGSDDGDDTQNTSGTSSIDESAVINRADINFATNGESTYRIVRPEGCSQEVNNCATELFKHFKNNVGVSPQNTFDTEEQGDNAEIIIGETNRPETAVAKQLLKQKNGRVNSYIIASVNKSIVIYGLSDESTVAAVTYFKDNFVKKETVTGGIDYSFVDSSAYSNISIGENTDLIDYVIVRPQYNLSYIATMEIEKLQAVLYDRFGYNVKLVKDSEGTATDREIVVGAAKRDGVEEIIEGDKISVKVSGSKVYLNGGSTYSVAAAVTEFCNMLKSGTDIKLNDQSSKQTDYTTVSATIDNKTDYKVTFKETFDGDTVDTAKWNNFNDYIMYGQNNKKTLRAKEDYSNLTVADGKFTVELCQDDQAYYGCMLTTQNKMCFKYGYFEISELKPKGPTFWTAFWNRPAFATSLYWVEIDVEENFGSADFSRGNLFPWLTSKGQQEGLTQQGGPIAREKYYYIDTKDLYSDFHTYGCEWDYDRVAFYRDGDLIEEVMIDDLSQPISIGLRNQHAYLILGATCGSIQLENDYDVDDVTEEEWTKTNKFIVDDMVVYQKADQDMKFDYQKEHYGYTTKMYYND